MTLNHAAQVFADALPAFVSLPFWRRAGLPFQ